MENPVKKLKLLPESSGVYVMLDENEQVIYVGKAKNLARRVKQYFYATEKHPKVSAMVANVRDFYYVLTDTEIDALSLENNLIKKYKPKYNILLKDDKQYPYLRIDLKEKFPHFTVVRKIRKDGARYFGPFMGGVSVREVLEIISQAFCLRTCTRRVGEGKNTKECLNYHIKKCLGPCNGLCTEEEYRAQVDAAVDFLEGNDERAKEVLEGKMINFAEAEEFELAVAFRERLKMLSKIQQRRITSLNRFMDADVIAVAHDGLYGAASVLVTRSGRMQGGQHYALDDASLSPADTLSAFVTGYYAGDREIPDEVILSAPTDDVELLQNYLRLKAGKTVSVVIPQRGIKKNLAEMAQKNAEDYLEKAVGKIKHKDDMTVTACRRLQRLLGLKRYPRRMECYDISNISGVDKVGSMVVFTDGEADRNEYRRFRIQTFEGADDFRSLQEVLTRRLSKIGTDEEEKFPRPDLVIIDGGKGQLSAVQEVFMQMGIGDIDLISLAEREEEIFTLNAREPVVLPHSDYVLRMLQRIRDEAHRFAITYHRNLRGKRMLSSILEEVDGIGKEKRKAIMSAFRTVEDVISASVEDLMKVNGIGKKQAEKIREHFRGER